MSKFNSHIKIVDGESKSLEESVMNPFDLFFVFVLGFFTNTGCGGGGGEGRTRTSLYIIHACVCVCVEVCASPACGAEVKKGGVSVPFIRRSESARILFRMVLRFLASMSAERTVVHSTLIHDLEQSGGFPPPIGH